MGVDPTERFGDRVDDYAKYRPGYPREVITTLEHDFHLTPAIAVADVGSGTGISARPFLEAGYEVFAVEPNGPMRAAAERDLGAHPRFHSVRGTAEDTTLAAASVGLVVAAQAFHWFDPPRARAELRRVLREPRLVALMWNDRRVAGPFLEAYERLLWEHGTDYRAVRRRDEARGDAIRSFFGGPARELVFANGQTLDHEGFFGRALSSSYLPKRGHPRHEGMTEALERLWTTYSSGGTVSLEYDTHVFVGRLE